LCESGDDGSGSGDDEDVADDVFSAEGEKISFLDIIELSVAHMVNSTDAKEKGDLLNRYFFTVKKGDSIWPKAIKETEKMTKLDFAERELADMENAIKHVYQRILECNLNNAGQKKKSKKGKAKDLVKCYMTLGEFIDDGFLDFGYPRGTLKGQAHMFEMNMAYNVMVLLIYHMLSGMEQAAMNMNSFETQLQFYRVAESLTLAVEEAAANSVAVRVESISPVEVCNIQEALWQEFPVGCDGGRAKRDVGAVRGIGGSADLFKQKFRATVTDDVTGETICQKEMTTCEEKDATDVKKELRQQCRQARQEYIKQTKAETETYYQQRAAPVVKELPKLWGNSKTKSTQTQEELEKKKRAKGSTSVSAGQIAVSTNTA
jgi:hypothetical protein